jgi:exopolyphosphatase/guanosine-5'-triphosphate,3'-diphosphate pyrophosphatase
MKHEKAPPSGGWGVMDLGTNTFHLLIVEGVSGDYHEIIHLQEPVKLGEGGINKGFIQSAAFERGIKTMQRFGELLAKHDVKQVKAIATSALRNAANGQHFIDEVKEKSGISIEIINGDEEAGYIYKGVRAGGSLSAQNSLIVDIGGGSVEFIICNSNAILWKQSFEIGAARLMDQFHRTDPIPPDSINALNLYLEDSLSDLLTAITTNPVVELIGSSGVFESYAQIIEGEKGNPLNLKTIKTYYFNYDELLTLIERIVLSTHQQRATVKGIIPVRVDMIVVASLLTRFIIKKLDIDRISMSANSLKEGVLADMMA